MFLMVEYFIESTDNCCEEYIEDCDLAEWLVLKFKSAENSGWSFVVTSIISVDSPK